MRFSYLLLIVACLVFSASASWNKEDSKAAIESITSKQLNTGLWDSLHETFAAVQVLDILGAKKINKDGEICGQLSKSLAANQLGKPSELFFAVATYKKLKCKADLPANVNTKVSELLKKPDEQSTEELRYLVGTIPLLGGAEKFGGNSLGKLIEVITDRMEDKGVFRSFKDVQDASIVNSGHAYKALAQLYRLKVFNKEQKEMLEASVDELAELMKSINKGAQDTAFFSDSKKDFVETTSVVIDGVFTLLASIKKVPPAFTSSIQGFANFFGMSKVTSGSPSEIYQVVRSLHYLSHNSLQRSISISLINPRLSTSATLDDRFVRIEVANALGEAIPGIKVYLTKAKAKKVPTVLIERQTMEPVANTTDNTLYQFNFLALKPSPGSYILSVRAAPETKEYQPFSADLTVSVVTSISIYSTAVSVSDNKDDHSAKKTEVDYPKSVNLNTLAAPQNLFLSFRVKNEKTQKPFVVAQAFLQIVNEKTSQEIILHALPKGTLYSLRVSLSENPSFWALGGSYKASLIVGDAHIEKGIIWKLLDFQTPENADLVKPDMWRPKPVIEHIFRAPEKRPPVVVSLAFAGLVLSPILVLFVGLGITGFKLGKLPGFGSLYYLLFIGGIVLIALVIVLYWLALNMFQALYYISIILAATIFVGQKALRSKATTATKPKQD